MRPLKNAPFCPISASYSKFNPRNIPYIPAVKFFVFLELEQKLTFFKGLKIITIVIAGYDATVMPRMKILVIYI